MTKKAVIIGINYVGTNFALSGCVNDAKNLALELSSRWGYSTENVKVICDDSGSQELPTFNNIIKYIDWLVEGAQPGDHLWFSYSGHGDYMADISGDEIDGRDETICPLDFETAGQISDDVLRKKLVDVLPKGVKLFCCFDSCHSGTVIDLRYGVKVLGKTGQQIDLSVTYQPNIRTSNCEVVCISGCRDEQTSADAFINGKFSGALTWALLDTLQKSPQGTIRCGDLIYTITSLVKKKGYTQVPQMSFGQSMSAHDIYDL